MDYSEGLPLVAVKKKKPPPTAGGAFNRTVSMVSNPQVSALDALKADNHQLLLDLIEETSADGDPDLGVDVNKAYPEEKYKTLLHVATEKGDLHAVKLLCGVGANTNLANRLLQTTPVHVAARKGYVDILRVLVANGANVNAAGGMDGKTALHILTKKCISEVKNEPYKQCMRLLLNQKDLDIDQKDTKSGQTALYLLASADALDHLEYVDMLATFLSHGADFSLKYTEDKEETIRDIVKTKVNPVEFQRLLDLAEVGIGNSSLSSAIRNDILEQINDAELGRDNFAAFEATLEIADASDLATKAPGEMSLVQRVCEVGLVDHLRALLAKGGDPNHAPSGTTPALIAAAKNGHFDIIYMLKMHKLGCSEPRDGVNFSVLDSRTRCSVLLTILKRPFSVSGAHLMMVDESKMEERYTRCLKVILEDNGDDVKTPLEAELRRVINAKDEMGNTALHYATQLWSQDIVRLLLEKGANIGMKNAYDEIPVENILPETMEAFLDEFCLTSEGDLTNKDFKVTARYDFLAPPRDLGDEGTKAQLRIQQKRLEGWTRNGKIENRGRSPTADNLEKQKPDNDDGDEDERLPFPETDVLWHMSQSKKHRHLLKHPVITSFLFMKWRRISSAYNRNLFFYFLFVCCLTSYIFCLYGGRSLRATSVLEENCVPDRGNNTGQQYDQLNIPIEVDVLWYINVVCLVVLILREFLQLGIAPRRYFWSPENWLEVSLMSLVSVLMFYGGYGCNVSVKRHVSAFVIFLSWTELITMVGRHPRLSEYNIYVTMFYKVIKTFLMFLLWYSFFIIGFALGFYILLHRDNGEPAGDNDYTFFNGLGSSIIKTFTMFVGELEFGDLPITTPVGYIFLLIFVFLIVVVMMNLLNGLAVSDTGIIREEAEITYYLIQVDVISYIESMLLGDPFNFLSNWPAFIWLRRFPSCSLGPILYRVPPLRKIFHKITGASRILLFYNYLPEKKITFYPNHDAPFCGCLRGDDNKNEHDFSPTIMESAKAVTLAKQQSKNGVEERLARTEAMLMEVKEENVKMTAALGQILKALNKE